MLNLKTYTVEFDVSTVALEWGTGKSGKGFDTLVYHNSTGVWKNYHTETEWQAKVSHAIIVNKCEEYEKRRKFA